MLVITDSREAISMLARSIARRFDLEFVAIALPRSGDWDVFEAGAVTIALDKRQLTTAFAAAQTSLEFDAYARTYAGHRTMTIEGRTVRLVPLRVGTRPIGLLAAAGRPIEAGTLDTLGGVVAIAIERAQFLEERKAGELTRQSEELKTALLASLGHDLRTPLTAIRVAASNIKASWLTADDRLEQSDLILAEVERLTRLFQNILEMARIDAGAIATESRWAHPSEIVAAARDQVEHTLHRHKLDVTVDPDVPVRLDPRLTATALAHLLENAAQYAPPGSAIDVHARVTDEGLMIEVRDHGPGIAAGRPAAPVRAVLSGRGGEDARVRHRHGPLDRPRPAGRRTGPDLGGELSGRRRRSSPSWCPRREGTGAREPRHPHDPTTLASCSSTMRSRSSARWGHSCARAAMTSTSPAPAPRRSEMVAEQPPDLIVLDLGLPDLEGTEVCRRVRADQTSRSSSCRREGPRQTKSTRSISARTTTSPKPFGPEELLARIRVALRRVVAEDDAESRRLPRRRPHDRLRPAPRPPATRPRSG